MQMRYRHAKTTSVFVVFLILIAAFPLKYDHEGICVRPHTFYWPGLELLTHFTGWNIRIFGCFSSSVNCWTESPICIRNNATLLPGVEVLFHSSWNSDLSNGVVHTNLFNGSACITFFRRPWISYYVPPEFLGILNMLDFSCRLRLRRHRCPIAYYANSCASFHQVLIGDLVFKLNPGPEGCGISTIVKSRHQNNGTLRAPQSRSSLSKSTTRNVSNFTKVHCLSANYVKGGLFVFLSHECPVGAQQDSRFCRLRL